MTTVLSPERVSTINDQTVDRSDMFYWQTDRPMTMEECAIIFGQRQNILEIRLVNAINNALEGNTDYAGVSVDRVEGNDHYTVGSVNINRNFVLSDGREVVGRFHPSGIKNGYFSVEAAVASLALQNNIPAVNPVAIHYAETASDIDFVVFEKANGANMKIWLGTHPEDEARLVGDVGSVMARLHQIKVGGYGFFDNDLARSEGKLRGIHSSYKEHVLAALPQNLAEIVSAGYINQKQADKITSLLEETDLIDVGEARLIHNDLADWNTIVDSGAVSAVIDWDEAHAGDPIADIACWSLFFPSPRLKLLLSGYQRVTDLPANFTDKLHIYRLRYVVSKLALRHKKYTYDKGEIMQSLIKVGRDALAEESKYFGLN